MKIAVTVVLAAAGFAVASIASGSSTLGSASTTTGTVSVSTATVTTATTTTATTTTAQTTTVVTPKRVTICHRTGSKKHPFVTITVSASSVAAHIKHGDLPGRCTAAKIKAALKKHKH